MTMAGGRVFNGVKWDPVLEEKEATGKKKEGVLSAPVGAFVDGNDEIFVNLASFRDSKRCGETIKSLFENAKDPSKVFVGLIEQNDPSDGSCVVEYCQLYGVSTGRRRAFGEDLSANRPKCPHFDQIRLLAVFNIAAMGPVLARSYARKVISNEEYCLQIDAHSDFASHWDLLLKQQWKAIGNEYGILSTVPPPVTAKSSMEPGGNNQTEVPRQCQVSIAAQGIPKYESPADGKAQDLERPLLSHAWSAAFSFAKCHLEENAPYDNFAPQLLDAEQFSRFARFWTRGYDVYTPTRNIVFHDYASNPDGIDPKGWTQKPRIRNIALKRMRTLLQIRGGESSQSAQANLGLFGLGKRRTMRQLMDFVGIDLIRQSGNDKELRCANHKWVPYDASIPPAESLYQNADDLDPQPEYPLRTLQHHFHIQNDGIMDDKSFSDTAAKPTIHAPSKTSASSPPINILILLWLFGLFVWYMMFVHTADTIPKYKLKSPKKKRKKSPGTLIPVAKDV